jgi:hypothetical protein
LIFHPLSALDEELYNAIFLTVKKFFQNLDKFRIFMENFPFFAKAALRQDKHLKNFTLQRGFDENLSREGEAPLSHPQ